MNGGLKFLFSDLENREYPCILNRFSSSGPIRIDISLFIGGLVETRNYRILSLVFILPVNSGQLKRI